MIIIKPKTLDTTYYNDLYVRDNSSDTGIIPSQGSLWNSPDIIPRQSETLSWETANETYNGPYNNLPIINEAANNIYVRAKNLNTVAGTGTVELYYTLASLFITPNKWIPIGDSGSNTSLSLINENNSTSIDAGGVAISNPPFLLTGLPPVIGDHYCLIAVLQTPANHVDIPTNFPTNGSFAQWVRDNPAVTYRNIICQPNTLEQLVQTFNFSNINGNATNFNFLFTGKGFEAGTKLDVQCPDQLCPINQNLTLPPPDQNEDQLATFSQLIPANFNGNLVVTVTSPNGEFPIGVTLSLTYSQYPDTYDDLEMQVAQVFRIPRDIETDPQGPQYTAQLLIPIGECTIITTTQ